MTIFSIALKFCVPTALKIFHKIWLQFSSFHLKSIVGYFQIEQWKKKPDSKREKHQLFTREEHAVLQSVIHSFIISFIQ